METKTVVQVHDKMFRESISEAELKTRIAELGKEISQEYAGKDPIIVSVLNGSFIFTADLVRELGFDPEIYFTRVSSYGDAMESSGQIKEIMGVEVSLKDRHVLVVEDIVDRGITVDFLRKRLSEEGPASISVVTLLYKEGSFKGMVPPEHVCFSIPNDFVVGYGLDYAQRGRHLKSIYVLAD